MLKPEAAAGPVGYRDLIADKGTEEAVQRNIIRLTRYIEQGTGEGVGSGIGVEGQRVLADEGSGLFLRPGSWSLQLAPARQSVVGLHPAEGDIVDFGVVAGDGRYRRNFDFVEVDLGYFHYYTPSARRPLTRDFARCVLRGQYDTTTLGDCTMSRIMATTGALRLVEYLRSIQWMRRR